MNWRVIRVRGKVERSRDGKNLADLIHPNKINPEILDDPKHPQHAGAKELVLNENDALDWKERKFKFHVSPLDDTNIFRVAKKRGDNGFRLQKKEKKLSLGIITKDNFRDEFHDRDLLILGDQMTLEFDASESHFPLSEEQGVWLLYQYEGETVEKKMPYEGNKVLFSRAAIFGLDGRDPDQASNFRIIYRDKATDTTFPSDGVPIKLGSLEFVDDTEVKAELKELLSNFLKLKSEVIENAMMEIEDEFEDRGVFFEDNLNQWLRDNYGFFEL